MPTAAEILAEFKAREAGVEPERATAAEGSDSGLTAAEILAKLKAREAGTTTSRARTSGPSVSALAQKRHDRLSAGETRQELAGKKRDWNETQGIGSAMAHGLLSSVPQTAKAVSGLTQLLPGQTATNIGKSGVDLSNQLQGLVDSFTPNRFQGQGAFIPELLGNFAPSMVPIIGASRGLSALGAAPWLAEAGGMVGTGMAQNIGEQQADTGHIDPTTTGKALGLNAILAALFPGAGKLTSGIAKEVPRELARIGTVSAGTGLAQAAFAPKGEGLGAFGEGLFSGAGMASVGWGGGRHAGVKDGTNPAGLYEAKAKEAEVQQKAMDKQQKEAAKAQDIQARLDQKAEAQAAKKQHEQNQQAFIDEHVNHAVGTNETPEAAGLAAAESVRVAAEEVRALNAAADPPVPGPFAEDIAKMMARAKSTAESMKKSQMPPEVEPAKPVAPEVPAKPALDQLKQTPGLKGPQTDLLDDALADKPLTDQQKAEIQAIADAREKLLDRRRQAAPPPVAPPPVAENPFRGDGEVQMEPNPLAAVLDRVGLDRAVPPPVEMSPRENAIRQRAALGEQLVAAAAAGNRDEVSRIRKEMIPHELVIAGHVDRVTEPGVAPAPEPMAPPVEAPPPVVAPPPPVAAPPPARVAPPPPPQKPNFAMPRDLVYGVGNYGYGKNNFKIEFDNYLDQAAYVIGGKRESSRHKDYEAALKKQGISVEDVKEHGAKIREELKRQARERVESGEGLDKPLRVKNHPFGPKEKPVAPVAPPVAAPPAEAPAGNAPEAGAAPAESPRAVAGKPWKIRKRRPPAPNFERRPGTEEDSIDVIRGEGLGQARPGKGKSRMAWPPRNAGGEYDIPGGLTHEMQVHIMGDPKAEQKWATANIEDIAKELHRRGMIDEPDVHLAWSRIETDMMARAQRREGGGRIKSLDQQHQEAALLADEQQKRFGAEILGKSNRDAAMDYQKASNYAPGDAFKFRGVEFYIGEPTSDGRIPITDGKDYGTNLVKPGVLLPFDDMRMGEGGGHWMEDQSGGGVKGGGEEGGGPASHQQAAPRGPKNPKAIPAAGAPPRGAPAAPAAAVPPPTTPFPTAPPPAPPSLPYPVAPLSAEGKFGERTLLIRDAKGTVTGTQGPAYQEAPVGIKAHGSEKLKAIGDTIRHTIDSIKSIVNPGSLSPAARGAELRYRQHAAELAHISAKLASAWSEASKHFEYMTPAEKIDFQDAIDTGRTHADPNMQGLADTVKVYTENRQLVMDSLKVDQDWLENYWPRLWKNHEKAAEVAKRWLAEENSGQPLSGDRDFQKHRKFYRMEAALGEGLLPLFENPIDQFLSRVHQMDKLIAAVKLMDALEKDGLVRHTEGELEEGEARIHDTIANGWAAPEAVAKLINNGLDPGLRSAGKPFSRAFSAIANANSLVAQTILGISGFHFVATGLNSVVTRFGQGLGEISEGEFSKGFGDIATSPLAPWSYSKLGKLMEQQYRTPGSHPEVAAELEAFIRGGGSFDRKITDSITTQISRAIKEGHIGTLEMRRMVRQGSGPAAEAILLKSFPAMLRLLSGPLMKNFVPHIKAGAVAEMQARDMRRLGPNASRAEVTRAMQLAQNSVENRFGQMSRDNLLWNKVFGDVAQLTFLSPSWNIGSVQEFGGGLVDITKALTGSKGEVTGKKASWRHPLGGEATHKAEYTVALPIVFGTIGAMIHLMTNPDEKVEDMTAKDYFYPKLFGQRVSIPGYMKDIYPLAYGFLHGKGISTAAQIVKNKLSTPVHAMAELIDNRTYYGTQIADENASFPTRTLQRGKYLASQLAPFSARSIGEMWQEGTDTNEPLSSKLAQATGSVFGVTKAPAYIDETDAERKAQDIRGAHLNKPRTLSEADHAKALRDLPKHMAADPVGGGAAVDAALESGMIRSDEAKRLRRQAGQSKLEERLASATAEDAMVHVYPLMTSAEKLKMNPILRRKIMHSKTASVERKRELLQLLEDSQQ